MSTHDVLAYAVAQEAVRRVARADPAWAVLNPSSYVTTSRAWPVPDFVIVDGAGVTLAAEFKPPRQSKREYLTGLGQASAYTRDFDYGLLIVPTVADDGYLIARHIIDVLGQPHFAQTPLGVIEYDPATLSPANPSFIEAKVFVPRASRPTAAAILDASFYAKWREMGPQEMSLLLSYSYDEMRAPTSATGTIRDRAFNFLWNDIQAGSVSHWGGGIRNYAAGLRTGVAKNYRNFLFHIGWTDGIGALTQEGLSAMHVASLYGPGTEPFLDCIASAVLGSGKHLVLFHAISDYQDGLRTVPGEQLWLDGLEDYLENRGLLKRNPARQGVISARQFLKAEKQLWRQLRLIKPRGARAFHPSRGFIFDWERITDLVQR